MAISLSLFKLLSYNCTRLDGIYKWAGQPEERIKVGA